MFRSSFWLLNSLNIMNCAACVCVCARCGCQASSMGKNRCRHHHYHQRAWIDDTLYFIQQNRSPNVGLISWAMMMKKYSPWKAINCVSCCWHRWQHLTHLARRCSGEIQLIRSYAIDLRNACTKKRCVFLVTRCFWPYLKSHHPILDSHHCSIFGSQRAIVKYHVV